MNVLYCLYSNGYDISLANLQLFAAQPIFEELLKLVRTLIMSACVVTVIPSSICFLITGFIILKSMRQMLNPSSKKRNKMVPTIRNLYYISSFLSMTTITICIIASSLCNANQSDAMELALFTISGALYFGLTFSILATLLMRIYFTFRGSTLEISNTQKSIFTILYTLTIIPAIISIIIGFIVDDGANGASFYFESPILSYFSIVSGIFYVITSIYGMYIFTQKMYQLTKLRASTMKNVFDEDNAGNLNKSQQDLLQTTSKYISLLALAIFTSFTTFLIFGIMIIIARVIESGGKMEFYAISSIFIVSPIDCTINMICLYLQYPFAKRYYDKYCKCFGRFWSYCLIKKTENAMKMRYKAGDKTMEVVAHIEEELKSEENVKQNNITVHEKNMDETKNEDVITSEEMERV